MSSSFTVREPWIRNASFDSIFILLPPFMAMLAVAILPARFKYSDEMPVAAWCILILFIDVAHVYSTLYNTYFDKERFARRRGLFIMVPLLCYVTGLLLYLIGGIVFWRALAYVAVFHFIRQQYGFMRLYARAEPRHFITSFIDSLTIYAATIYPIIYWHCTPSRNFNWFVSNDFFITKASGVKAVALVIYIIILAAYVGKELFLLFRQGSINMPKNVLIAGTVVSWYFGIVYFNGDMAFTLLNVVSHGIPYMALVWFEVKKQDRKPLSSERKRYRLSARWYGVFVFLGSLFLLAYLEEGLWDGFVWREHGHVFAFFKYLPHINNDIFLALMVPLLSLPQSTHYILDGFIWRKKYA